MKRIVSLAGHSRLCQALHSKRNEQVIRGIHNLTVTQIQQRIQSFDRTYVDDWDVWLAVRRNCSSEHTPPEFGRILRRWQACRPNRMRVCSGEATHRPPYLEDLVCSGLSVASALNAFDLSDANTMTQTMEETLLQLWDVFKDLSYSGRSRDGLAGVVGISKAVLLLTEGRVGPAFDSKVRGELGITKIPDAKSWIKNLKRVAEDIAVFEQSNQCTLRSAIPEEYKNLHYGRLYDMIFGPSRPGVASAAADPKTARSR